MVAAGFKLVWANDSDPSACATFRHRFSDVDVIEKDVKDLRVREDRLKSVDVMIGGFPCQSFSQAGDRRGFDDPRGELFLEIPRLLMEFGIDKQPPLVILENVPYLLYGADGTWFERIQYNLRQAGYWFRRESCWTTNVREAANLPQDRSRLFMVAASRHHFSFNPFVPPETPIQTPDSAVTIDDLVDRTKPGRPAEYLPPGSKYYNMISDAIENGTSASHIYQLRRSYVREKHGGICPTLTANMGLGGHNVPFILDNWGIRRLSIEEVAKLQGFNVDGDLFPAIRDNEKYRLLGNSVCVKLAEKLAITCYNIFQQERLNGAKTA